MSTEDKVDTMYLHIEYMAAQLFSQTKAINSLTESVAALGEALFASQEIDTNANLLDLYEGQAEVLERMASMIRTRFTPYAFTCECNGEESSCRLTRSMPAMIATFETVERIASAIDTEVGLLRREEKS